MALQLNLLHEQFSEQRQRQRDPLKLGIYGLVALRRGPLSLVRLECLSNDPDPQPAQHRAGGVGQGRTESHSRTKTRRGTRQNHQQHEDSRWLNRPARFIGRRSSASSRACVTPNIQLIGLDGNVADAGDAVALTLEGVSAGTRTASRGGNFPPDLQRTLDENLQRSEGRFPQPRRPRHRRDAGRRARRRPRVSSSVLSFNPKPPAPEAAAAETAAPRTGDHQMKNQKKCPRMRSRKSS